MHTYVSIRWSATRRLLGHYRVSFMSHIQHMSAGNMSEMTSNQRTPHSGVLCPNYDSSRD